MRRPQADLEEKREPRVALIAGARKGVSMSSPGRSLTRAAIEKRALVPGTGNRSSCPRPWKNALEEVRGALRFSAMTVVGKAGVPSKKQPGRKGN